MLWSDIIFGSNVFSFVLIIFSYTVYTTPKNKTKQTQKQTNNCCLYNQLLLKSITVLLGRIYYWWWENTNKQDHANHGA